MPFGISSAPEVWQRKMHETIEGLEGTEVIADDFLIMGKDDAEHDINLHAFLMRCRDTNIVLNPKKVRYKLHGMSADRRGHQTRPEESRGHNQHANAY